MIEINRAALDAARYVVEAMELAARMTLAAAEKRWGDARDHAIDSVLYTAAALERVIALVTRKP